MPSNTNAQAKFVIGKVVSLDGKDYGKAVYAEDRQKLFYKLVIINRGNVSGDFILQDKILAPSNGGSVNIIPGSERNTCPNYTESCTGSIFTELSVKKLKPGKSVVVYYQAAASTKGIPSGESSQVPGIMSLSNGQKSTATVTISNGSKLSVGKVVSPDGVSYSENLARKNGEKIFFKVVVINSGIKTQSVKITDTFGKPKNSGKLVYVPKSEKIACQYAACRGSLFAGGITIQNLPVGKSVVVYYQAMADTSGVPNGEDSQITGTVFLSNGQKDTATVTLTSGGIPQQNLIKNGGFEKGGDWNNFQGGYTRVSGGHTGAWSIKIAKSDPNGSSGAYQRVNLKQITKKSVSVGGYIKGENIRNTTGSFIGASIYAEIHLRSGKVIYWNSTRNEGTFDWKWIGFNTGSIAAVNEPIDHIYIVPILHGSTGSAYFDDITVKQ